MNAETMRRLVRAIAECAQDDLVRLAYKLVDAQRKTGHAHLAEELRASLDEPPGPGTFGWLRHEVATGMMSSRGVLP